MKNFNFLILIGLSALLSCSKSSMDDFDIIKEKIGGSSTGGDASKMLGIWQRNDGQAETYLKLEGTVATTCNSGTETVGIFDASVPSATFVVSGVTYVFGLHMAPDATNLIVEVPDPYTGTHVETEYVQVDASVWPCGTSGGTGGGSFCFVGAQWTKSDCNGAVYTIQFFSNNTGVMSYTGCSAYSVSSSRYEFNWTESSGSITYTYTHCERPIGTTISTFNGGSQSYSCTSSSFTTGGDTWTH